MRQAIPQERLVLKGIGEEEVGGMSVNHHGPCSFTQCPDSSLDDGLFSVGSVEVVLELGLLLVGLPFLRNPQAVIVRSEAFHPQWVPVCFHELA